MKVFFFLSGEHKTLPRAEVLAALESLGAKYNTLDYFDQVLALETDRIDDIHEKLALTHKICELQGVCSASEKEIYELLREWDIPIEGSFSVRIRRVREYGKGIKSSLLERKAGEIIKKKTGARVDLENPDILVYGVISEKFVLGKLLHKVDRSAYENRRPHLRPFFRPGAMLPRTSRALVNLTRIKKGDRFLDPFCGSGGFLIEAGLIGAKVYGCDVDYEAISGCKKNLEYYGIKNYRLEMRDARTLGERYSDFFDAIAADLPYGISSSTHGATLEELYTGAMETFMKVLKPGKHICVISPEKIELEKIASEVGFKIREIHFERIHRSLTRKMLVARK
jgi:tRNA (guanine10-N2)-dimethyltransferase